ncbi:MAG TPA: hypothetical protein VH253_02490 [Phycisphaerae bacterium]|nr:hypothetical protein [Phycisphaerae bacterium]
MIRRAVVLVTLMVGAGALAQATRPGNLLRDGNFEAAPGPGEVAGGWSEVREGGAAGTVALDASRPLNDKSPHALKLSVAKVGDRMGAATGGLDVAGDQWYEVTLSARTDNNFHVGLVFSLESADGKTVAARVTLPEIGGAWKGYGVALHAESPLRNGRLVVSPIEPGTIWIDELSLAPREASHG